MTSRRARFILTTGWEWGVVFDPEETNLIDEIMQPRDVNGYTCHKAPIRASESLLDAVTDVNCIKLQTIAVRGVVRDASLRYPANMPYLSHPLT